MLKFKHNIKIIGALGTSTIYFMTKENVLFGLFLVVFPCFLMLLLGIMVDITDYIDRKIEDGNTFGFSKYSRMIKIREYINKN